MGDTVMRSRFLLAALLVLGAVTSSVAPAVAHADVTPQQLYGLRVEAPYEHYDTWERRWIYGASSSSDSQMRSLITQNYGGEWHVVGTYRGPDKERRAIGLVLCTGGQKNYQFRTVGQVWYGGRWYSTYSSIKTFGC